MPTWGLGTNKEGGGVKASQQLVGTTAVSSVQTCLGSWSVLSFEGVGMEHTMWLARVIWGVLLRTTPVASTPLSKLIGAHCSQAWDLQSW